uniref:Leishmanolysin-like peptidase n=1 Tax=Haemonchus contortus TaxID=6289 RepID=A0A7I5ED49_HAECO
MNVRLFHATLAVRLILACDYVPPKPEDVIIAKTEYAAASRSKREAAWDWIRIETEYDSSFNLLTEDKKELLEDLITTARDYFETTVKVRRLASLQLAPSCQGQARKFPNDTYLCAADCEKRCGGAIASQDAHYFMHCVCLDIECPTKQYNWGGKLTSADFVLFVSVIEGNCGKQTLAYAQHCALDKDSNRPIAGHVNVCPSQFHKMKSNEFGQWIATIKHELIHAFVFSSSLFQLFPGAGKMQREGEMTVIPNVVHRFTRQDWETANGAMKHNVYMMVTPKVREEARRHFNCSTLEGAEIENQGGPATASGHWEKRVFENEAMSGVATQVYAISRLTLALFEDSGWYKVNYDKAEPMMWGRNLGCNFATKSCLTWMKFNPSNPYPFCKEYEDVRCSVTRTAKVRCTLLPKPEPPPPEYNYNIKGLYYDKKGKPVYGLGVVYIADYCPYYRVYGDVSREDSDTRCTFSGNMNYNNYSLEVFSPTARCFNIDGGITVENREATYSWMHNVGCYETICKNNLLMIKTQNSKFYPCYRGGQIIHVEKRVRMVGTVKFRIVCPSCPELCGAQFCAPDKNVNQRIGDPTRSAMKPWAQLVPVALLMLFLST